VILEEGDVFFIPDNCWAFDAETKQFIVEKSVTKERANKIVLVPKIAGG